MTSLPSSEIRALTSASALERALAHASLTETQVCLLYVERWARERAFALRRLGRRIRLHRLEELCVGLPERRLTVIFGSSRSRRELIAALAQETPTT